MLGCLAFVLFILSYSFAGLFSGSDESVEEQRDFSFSSLITGKNAQQFEASYAAGFGNPEKWQTIASSLLRDAGTTSRGGIYFCNDNRLIRQHLQYDEEVLQKNIDAVNQYCTAHHISGIIMTIPDASLGEKRFLPFGAYQMDEKKLTADLAEAFKTQRFVDITARIGTGDDHYFRTDEHWNAAGAKTGYDAITADILDKAPNDFTYREVSSEYCGPLRSASGAFWTKPDHLYTIIPSRPDPLTVTFDDGRVMNSLYSDVRLGEEDKYAYYLDGPHAHTHIESTVAPDRHAVIIHDSWSRILMPYLASEYRTIDAFDASLWNYETGSFIDDNTDVYFIFALSSFASDSSISNIR